MFSCISLTVSAPDNLAYQIGYSLNSIHHYLLSHSSVVLIPLSWLLLYSTMPHCFTVLSPQKSKVICYYCKLQHVVTLDRAMVENWLACTITGLVLIVLILSWGWIKNWPGLPDWSQPPRSSHLNVGIGKRSQESKSSLHNNDHIKYYVPIGLYQGGWGTVSSWKDALTLLYPNKATLI